MSSFNQNEINRILNVVTDLIQDIEILQYVPSNSSDAVGAFISQKTYEALSPLAQDALQDLLDAENELQALLQQQQQQSIGNSNAAAQSVATPSSLELHHDASSATAASKSKLSIKPTTKRDISVFQEKVRLKTTEVCFQFRKCNFTPDPQLDEKAPNLARFLDVLKQYREILEDNLYTTVEEEESRKEVRNATTTRENKATADVKALNRELDSERAARGREMDQRKQDVKKLRSEILLLQENEEAERAATTERLASKEKQKQEEFNQMKEYLQRQIQNIADALQKKKEENLQLETKMRVMRKNSETKVGSVVQKYDQFMSETTEKLQNLKEAFETDSKRVEFLEQELKDFSQKKLESEKSEAERKEILRRNLVKAQAFVNAKVVISRAWQNYKKRNASSKKKKGRKGKKKG